MLTADAKLISVDDHVVEPPHLWVDRLPKAYAEVGPRVVEVHDGNVRTVTLDGVADGPRDAEQFWLCEDRRTPVSLQGSPTTRNFRTDGTDDDFYARSYRDMIPAAYDVRARLAAMDEDGVWAATLFPSYLRFAATGLLAVNDKDGLGRAIVRAYNDWMVDEWCAAEPARFIPMMILPLWDPAEAGREIRRCAAKGFKCITMPENPVPLGLPSYWTDHWEPVFQAAEDTGLVLCMHIGTSGQLITTAPEASKDVSFSLVGLNSMSALADLCFSGALERHPGVRIALSEGGSGWVPYVLERMQYTWERSRLVTNRGLSPTELFERHFWTCFISDRAAIANRHAIGVHKLMWEGDFPHNDSQYPNSRALLAKDLADVPDDEANQIVELNARRLFDFWG